MKMSAPVKLSEIGGSLDAGSDEISAQKKPLVDELLSQARQLLHGARDFIANAAKISALLFERLPNVNWAGFYLLKGDQLVLGPFQGKPACTRIAMGKGVCGTAAAKKETVVVANVHEFPAHIACDPESKSEIVLPLVYQGRLLGVLDLDSPHVGRFDAADQTGLERIVEALLAGSELPAL